MSAKSISLRDARKLLKGVGFEMTRRSGKHEVWRHSDGRSVSLPHTPVRDGLHGYLAHKVRTYARGERLTYQKVGTQ